AAASYAAHLPPINGQIAAASRGPPRDLVFHHSASFIRTVVRGAPPGRLADRHQREAMPKPVPQIPPDALSLLSFNVSSPSFPPRTSRAFFTARSLMRAVFRPSRRVPSAEASCPCVRSRSKVSLWFEPQTHGEQPPPPPDCCTVDA